MYHYLVSKDGKPLHLVEASSPSVAIADAAKDTFTAQRVEGAVVDALKLTVPVRTIPKRETTTEDPPADPPKTDGEAETPGDDPGTDETTAPKGDKNKGGE